MRKTLFSLMTLVALCVNADVIGSYYLVFSYVSPTTCKVKARNGATLVGDLVIPERNPNNSNQRVVEIEYSGFMHQGTGSGQTNTLGITSVTIPSSVTTIGNFAFYRCAGIKNVDLSACEVTDFVGKCIFSECDALESAILPDKNLTKIADGMFYSCKKLKSINIPHTVTQIGRGAFYGCSELASVNSYDSGHELQENSILAQTVDSYAFYRCTALTAIGFKERTTQVRNYAFYNCSSLAQLTVAAPVEAIGDYAFYNTAINTVEWNNSVFQGSLSVGFRGFPTGYAFTDPVSGWGHVDDHMQYMYSTLTIDYKKNGGYTPGVTEVFDIPTDSELPNPNKRLAYCPQPLLGGTDQDNYTLEAGTSFIDAMAMNNTQFKTVTLNDGLVYIDAGAFSNMTRLRELTIPGSVKRFAPSDYNTVIDWGNVGDLQYFGSGSGSSKWGICRNTPGMAYLDMSTLHKDNFSASYDEDEFSVRNGLFNGTTYRNNSIYVGQNCFAGMYNPTLVYLPVDTEDKWADEDFEVYGLNFIFTDSQEQAYTHLYEIYDYFQNDGVGTAEDNYRGGRDYYAIPHGFLAETARYKRSFNAGCRYTVCLPFAVDAGRYGTFYEMSDFDAERGELVFKAISGTATQPRTPYVFIPSADCDELVAVQAAVSAIPDGIVETGTYVEDEKTLVKDGEVVARFVGGYETHEIPAGAYTFDYDGGPMPISGAGISLYPFHAYFWCKDILTEELHVIFEGAGKPQIEGEYRSRFDVSDLRNDYTNSIRVVNTLSDSPALAQQFEVGMQMLVNRFDRKDADALTVATITITGKDATPTGHEFAYSVHMPDGTQVASGTFTADAAGIVDFNGLTVVDTFGASTALNDHLSGYRYQLTMIDAQENELTTNVVDVPVYKTKHTATAAGFTYNQVYRDTDHALDLSRPIPAAVRVIDDSAVSHYELLRNKQTVAARAAHNADGTYTTFGNTADGWQTLTQQVGFSAGETMKMVDLQDYANPSDSRIYYTPVITATSAGFDGQPITNTYGSLEKELKTCPVEIKVTDAEKTKVLAGPVSIDGVGTLNSFMGYAATVTLTAQLPDDDSSVYMYRLWRVHPDGSEVLLNKYQSTSANNNYPGHPWGSDYTALAKRDNEISVRDVFLYYPISQLDNNLCPVRYIARLYSKMNTPAASAPRGRQIISSGYDISENEITIEFSDDEIPTGVAAIESDKTVAAVKYYNPAGIASHTPFDGLNIVVTDYVDGTRKVTKVFK